MDARHQCVAHQRFLDEYRAYRLRGITGPARRVGPGGIDPEIAAQLFQPFVTSKRTGMGVGLSISRTIVEAHGGRIWAEPKSGGGSTFHFTVPRVQQEEMADAG